MAIEAMSHEDTGADNNIRIDTINITSYKHHIDYLALRQFDLCMIQETSIPKYKLEEAKAIAREHRLMGI
eukprot:11014134-Karenia_brevis.AAC.1